ncbi:MAG: endonuclease/exonuclease/phosphatase family protein [Aeromicrobium sp.]
MAVTMFAMVGALGAGLWATRALTKGSDAPSELTAKAVSPTGVVLGWKGASGADSYVVKIGSDRALTGAGTKAIKASAKGKTTLTVSDLAAATPGVDLFYRVDAVRDGQSTSSRTSRFSLLPGKVGTVKVDRLAADGVRIKWATVANSRQYEISIARDKEFIEVDQVVRTLGSASRFVTASLEPSTNYWIKVKPLNAGQSGAFSAAVPFTTKATEAAFRVATWNVCSEKCGGYASRAPVMSSFLNANKVDMFGLQESGGKRVGQTTNAIFSGRSQKYQRASGGAQARYIFYRPALFRQLNGGYFPIGHGRHTTWGKFQIRKTGRIFYFVDVHLENGKGNDSKRSAEMNVMLARMASINDKGLPMIYAGDFNSGRHRGSDSPGVKMRAAGFTDSFLMVKKPVNGQFNTSFPDGGRPASGAQVDHIWVSKSFKVSGWKQLLLNTNRFISDHNALAANVSIESNLDSIGEPTPITTVSGLTQSLQ